MKEGSHLKPKMEKPKQNTKSLVKYHQVHFVENDQGDEDDVGEEEEEGGREE